MGAPIPDQSETVAPSEADVLLARESSRRLATHELGPGASVPMKVLDGGDEAEAVSVPASAMRLFLRLLNEMSLGHAVTLTPSHVELTTQQAADVLNVSRPYMARLVDEGKLPSRTVGECPLVRLDDLMAFKQKDDAHRARILDQLTAEAQELGMGY